MAWLSGLAGKAENLLNKIDQNTAAVLNKDKYDLPQAQLTEVTWISPQLRDGEDTTMQIPLEVTTGNSVRSIVSTDISGLKEEDLVKFLNMPNINPQRNGSETITPPTPSSLVVEHATDSTDSVSELSVYSTESTPEHTRTSTDVSHVPQGTDIRIQKHNFQLGVKIEKPNIISVDSTRALIENEKNIEEQFSVAEQQNKYELNKQVGKQTESQFTLPSDYYVGTSESKEEEDTAERRIDFYIKQDMDQQKEIAVLNEKLEALEAEKEQLLNQLNNFQITLEKNRSDLYLSRSELEQHKARALRTLQEKEKLIAELKNNVTAGTDDAIIMELNQLRQERDILREENQQISEQLRIVRDELDNADVKLEKMRHESTESNIQAQEILASERRRRLDAEEDTKLHSEEIRSLKDELFRQHSNFAAKLKSQESEISKLKLQLSASSTPSSEVESRLTSLTQTLVIKQQALESLTTERNALRLQLEKIEHEFKTALGNNRRNTYSSVNDTDDAKAQVPTFLIETPFDTGVTRRVKRAYSSLDAISIRTGVFLRRYPLARILVLIYMALLQFWVLVVLLSESPDAR